MKELKQNRMITFTCDCENVFETDNYNIIKIEGKGKMIRVVCPKCGRILYRDK